MKRFIALLVLFVVPLVVLAQSVPGPAINPNCNTQTGQNCTIWTPSQWISAWQAKMDATAGAIAAALGYTPLNKAGDTMSGPLTVAPSSNVWSGSTAAPTFKSGVSATGVTSASAPSLINFGLTDSLDGSALTNTPITGINEGLNYGGGTTKGGRTGLNVTLCQCNGADTDSGASNFYVGLSAYSFFRNSQPGATSTAALGRVFGINANSQIQNGFTANNLAQVSSAEFDVGISTGSSAAIRSGVDIASVAPTAGYNSDEAIWIYGSTTSASFQYGLQFGDTQSWAIASSGTMFGSRIANTSYNAIPFQAAWGVDLSQVTFPSDGNPYDGGFLRSSGFAVDGAGTINQGSCYTSSNASGRSLNCTGSVGTSAAISAAGSGYTNGTKTIPVTAYGGVWLLNASAGIPNAITQLVAPVYPTTSVPSNPVTPTNINPAEQGTGLTLTITWNTTANKISETGNPQFLPASLPGGPKAGRFYAPALTGGPTGSAVTSANRLWVAPIFVGAPATVKTLAFDISAGNASAWNARMCVFADTGAGFPGALAVDSGTDAIGSGSVTGVQSVSLNSGSGVALTGPAWYWVGLMADSASESLEALGAGAATLINSQTVGFNSASNLFTLGFSNGYYMSQTLSSGCPGNFSGSPTDSNGQATPYIAMGY